jgi:hypothetical protein
MGDIDMKDKCQNAIKTCSQGNKNYYKNYIICTDHYIICISKVSSWDS